MKEEKQMRTQVKILLIAMVMILIPFQNLCADVCDDDYQQAKDYLESAREAHNEKDYESAAEYFGPTADQSDRPLNLLYPEYAVPRIRNTKSQGPDL